MTMWTIEHSIQTPAPVQRVWGRWADVESWPEWNADIERIALDGPFAEGSTIQMTPVGAEPVELRIAAAVEPELFIDQAEFAGVVVRTEHRADPVPGGGTRITYRIEVSGTDAEAIGQAISADFPQTLASLARIAQG
jgi:uncharacterized protein YndB with AHSA1/START domain